MVGSPAVGNREAQESWTYVANKRHRNSARKHPRVRTDNSATLSATTKSRPATSSSLTVSDIQRDHDHFREQWLNSSSHQHLKELLGSGPDFPVPSAAVCLGLGSFDPEDGSWQVKRRTHVQLAAFTTLVQFLEQRGTGSMRCVFQEPCFTDADKDFLQTLNYEVVDSPVGFEMVSEDSLLFGIHLYRDTYSEAIAHHIPALFIGTGYDVWESCNDPKALDWARMKELDRVCQKSKFPDEEDFYPTFTGTSIHWRRPQEEDCERVLTSAMEDFSISKS